MFTRDERFYLMERIEELITTPITLVTINISKTPLTDCHSEHTSTENAFRGQMSSNSRIIEKKLTYTAKIGGGVDNIVAFTVTKY